MESIDIALGIEQADLEILEYYHMGFDDLTPSNRFHFRVSLEDLLAKSAKYR